MSFWIGQKNASVADKRKFRIRQAADNDLLDIFAYGCENFGADTAEAYIYRLEAGFRQLTEHPKLGRSIEQSIAGVRALPVVSHVVYYEVTDTTIEIIRILHKSMLPERYVV